jgi:hypothetical protein
MAKNFRAWITTTDSGIAPVTFETVEDAPVSSNVLPHIKTLCMDVSGLDDDRKSLLCNALREAADFIEHGTRELAEGREGERLRGDRAWTAR